MTIMQKIYWLIASIGNLLALYLFSQDGNFNHGLLLLATVGYTVIGFYDMYFSRHSLNRLYPVVAYIRYFLESYRIEIQQYFIANDTEENPFNREQRTLVYQRAKNISDTIAFGTQRNLLEENYLSLWHSLEPKVVKDNVKSVVIGGPDK